MVDDLEDSSSEEKTLHNQPSIGTLARDLFLCDKESDYKKCLGDVSRAQEKGNGMEGSPGITDQGAGKEDGQSQAGHGTDDDDDRWDNLEDLHQLGHPAEEAAAGSQTECKAGAFPGPEGQTDSEGGRVNVTNQQDKPGDGISSIPWINYLLSYLPSLGYLFSLFWFTVGIITEKEDCGWMEKLLRSADFKDHVDDVQSICSSRDGDQETKDKVSLCSFLVLYHTGGVRDDLSDLGDRLHEMENLCLKNGQKNVVIVVGDLEDTESEKKMRKEWCEIWTHKLGCELLLFTRGEIESCKRNLGLSRTEKGKLEQIKDNMTRGSWLHNWEPKPKHTIGIFSRSGQSDYKWLGDLLRSEDFRDQVQDVRPGYISNAGGRQFREDVSQCTFAILYHTKNRGRINITDVTDSLYDDELGHLSAVLGKENLIVVVDDLEDSSSEEKRRILQNQPSIGRLAQDLILFTKEETDPAYKKPITAQDPEDERSLTGKLEKMTELLKDGKENLIVVVDDLEDSSSEEKRRILQNQPSIGRLAQDLILFTKEETDPAYKKPITAQDPEDERSLTGKLEKMTELLKDGKQRLVEEAAKKKREEKAENKEQLNTAGQGE